METIHRASNVDFSLLARAKEREREATRQIKERGLNAFLLSMLGVGIAVISGGLAVTFGLLYVINWLVRLMI